MTRQQHVRFAPFSLVCILTIFMTGCTGNSTTLHDFAIDFARQALAAYLF